MKISIPARLLSVLSIFLLLNTSIFSQEIAGIEIIPENPSGSDEVFLIVETSFPFLDCTLDSVHHFYACGAYALDGFYNTGFETGECQRTDTISLGNLPTGPCLITYRMYYLGWSQVDQIDTFITVGTVGIDKLVEQSSPNIKIWPNPSKGKINLEIKNKEIDKLTVRSISGTYSETIDLNLLTNKTINTISLQAGMYICTAYSKDYPISMSKFIVLE
jgi:hypothetical protein